MASSNLVIKMPKLHHAQMEVLQHPARFKVLCSGRRWGKTFLGVALCMERTFHTKRMSCWVAPTYKTANSGWRVLKKLAKQIPNALIKESEKRVEFPFLGDDAAIEVRSADKADNIRGVSLCYSVLDEFAFFKSGVFNEVIRPCLSDQQGGALIISTPKGRGDFWELYQKGLVDDFPDFASFNFDSKSNPYFPEEEWYAAKSSLPERVFKQEYMAEFTDDGGGVFVGLEDVLNPTRCSHSSSWAIGIDVARKSDYTALVALCRTCGDVKATSRFNGNTWSQIEDKILAFTNKWKPHRVTVDATGVGDAIFENLRRKGLNAKPFIFTNSSKEDIITSLQFGIEQKLTSISPRENELIGELQRFEYCINPKTRKISFNAPEGFHDDLVCAYALAYSLYNPRKATSKALLAR